jgi:hypothetical protein
LDFGDATTPSNYSVDEVETGGVEEKDKRVHCGIDE